METYLHVGRGLCGHDGIVHGGLLATILDEAMARVVRSLSYFSTEFCRANMLIDQAPTAGCYESGRARRSHRESDHKLPRAHAG